MKLMTVDDVVSLFGGVTIEPLQLMKFAREQGVYRKIGSTMFFTEGDVAELVRRASPTRRPAGPYPPETEGVLVVIAPKAIAAGIDSVFLGWSPLGGEADLLSTVQLGHPERRLCIWGTPIARAGEVAALREEFASARQYGYWFAYTAELRDRLKSYGDI